MQSMSGGSWTYNRFDAYEAKLAEAKKADKDYDGDGEVESSKDEYFGSKDKAIKKAMGKGTCKKCEESKDDCECDDKKEVKESNMVGAPSIKNAKQPTSTPVKYDKKMNLMAPTIKKEETELDEGSCGGYQEGGEVKAKKKKVVKEDVINHLIENGYVNNEVSADILFNHMSDEYLESIEEDIMEGFQPLPKSKMANQANKAYGKEQSAVKAGDESGANKQMQRRIAMNNPMGRKAQLAKG
jgi:hypothetical protein